jgi:hypothetical protein
MQGIGMACLLCLCVTSDSALAAKRKKGPIIPPELKIVSVMMAPTSYMPGNGTLDFAIEVELPKHLDRDLLLEVSVLISSPSMRSMRFLSSREAVDREIPGVSATSSSASETKPRVEVILMWDGTDQSKELAGVGKYDYEIRAKLLTVGDNGARTHMNAWPKRGTLLLKDTVQP